MADVQKIILDRFLDVYGEPPKRADIQAFYEEYEKALMGWSNEILEQAVGIVIAEHEYPGWPMPGVVTKACKRVCPQRQVTPDQPLHEPVKLSEIQHERMNKLYDETMKILREAGDRREKMGRPALPDVSRPAFEKMQRESPNPQLHMTQAGLTALSKRMTGERE